MKQLNLIEKKEQEKIELELIISSIRSTMSLVVLITCLVAILISTSAMLLNSQLIISMVDSTPISSTKNKLNEEFSQVANLLNQVATIQKNYWSTRNLIIEISQLTPAGNTLYSLLVDKSKKTVLMAGFALKREDLIKFQRNLEDSHLFSEVTAPLANLFKKENINFQFEAKLK